jgi:hypothetical protein
MNTLAKAGLESSKEDFDKAMEISKFDSGEVQLVLRTFGYITEQQFQKNLGVVAEFFYGAAVGIQRGERWTGSAPVPGGSGDLLFLEQNDPRAQRRNRGSDAGNVHTAGTGGANDA